MQVIFILSKIFITSLLIIGVTCSIFGQEASFDVSIDTVQVDSFKIENADTLTKKELKKIKQAEKWANAGPFFDHSDRPGRKAALYALGVPGLGQIYNRKYWKLPIVYGAVGTTLYFAISNGKQLSRLNKALEIRLSGGEDEFFNTFTESQLTIVRNNARKNTELSAILTGLFHGLSIIDATVDAHLFEFDISDDLSLRWYPNFLTGNNNVIPSVHLSLHFN